MRGNFGKLSLSFVLLAALSLPTNQASAFSSQLDEPFTELPAGKTFDDGARFSHWRVVFDGVSNGRGVRVSKGGLILAPQSAQEAATTNSSLVVSRRKFTQAPLHLSATWTTQRSTRVGAPNPWEAGWLVWDYLDAAHFTYLILKPNGWEVGRRDPSQPGGQRFIADGPAPATPIGMQRTATVDRVYGQSTIRVDGDPLTTFTLPMAENRGSVGMYSEDAVVLWQRIAVASG